MKVFATVLLVLPLAGLPQEDGRPSASMTGLEIVEWMERHSDRRFVMEELQIRRQLQERKASISDGVLAADRAHEVGLSLLRTLGFAGVAMGPKVLRIVPLAQARMEPLPVWTSPEDLPTTDEFGILLIPVRNLSPHTLVMALSNSAGVQALAPHVESRTIAVTGFASNCRTLSELATTLDRRAASTPLRLRVGVLMGARGTSAVPEEFGDSGLAKAAPGVAFGPVSEATLRLDAEEQPPGRPSGTEGMVRLGTSRPVSVEFTAQSGADGRVVLERFVVRDDADRAAAGARLLETRLDLKEEGWTLAGCVPADKSGAVVAVLVKTERTNR